jgi:hypothetical protein
MDQGNAEDQPHSGIPDEGRHRSEDVGTALRYDGRHRLIGTAGTPTQRTRWNGATSEQPLIDTEP